MLGVDRHADAAAIRSAYRRLVRTAHPDKGGDPEVFRQLSEAYVVLCDDVLRADYEQALADQAANGPVEFFTDTQGCKRHAAAVQQTRHVVVRLYQQTGGIGERLVLQKDSGGSDAW